MRRLNDWGGQPLPLNASCWVEDAGPTPVPSVARRAAAVEAACPTLGGERLDDAQAARTGPCAATSGCPGSRSAAQRELWRLSVPQTTPVLDLPEPPLVEWHGAQRWVRAEPADAARVREAAVRAAAMPRCSAPAEGQTAVAALDTLAPPLTASIANSNAVRSRRHLQPRPPVPGLLMQTNLSPEFEGTAEGRRPKPSCASACIAASAPRLVLLTRSSATNLMARAGAST